MGVSDGDAINVLGRRVEVMDVAAHTSAHIAFILRDDAREGPKLGTAGVLWRHTFCRWLRTVV
jgi:hydroxyacylglutathione hydrolase